MWIPSHIDITGNELADELAKLALSSEKISKIKLPHTDIKHAIKQYTQSIWQEDWNKQEYNKLHSIKPKLQPRKPLHLSRRDSVVLTRLKIGHTPLTHQFLLTQEEKPFCVSCQKDFTIRHILTDCAEFNEIRSDYYRPKNIKDIFDVVEEKKIIGFI